MSARIFISHSHDDKETAEALVSTLNSALPGVPITCTSSSEHESDERERISEAVRALMNESVAVFALLTPRSLRSEWVLFELGACWASSKQLVPILGPGLSPAQLPNPLEKRSHISIVDEQAPGQIRQALQETARLLDIDPVLNEETDEKVDEFVAAFLASDTIPAGEATEHVFVCTDADVLEAKQVHIAGSFNEWLYNKDGAIVPDERYAMELVVVDGKPKRSGTVRIARGANNFKFVVGSNQWIPWTEGCGFERGTDAPGGPNCRVVGK